MAGDKERIDELLKLTESMMRRQESFSREIDRLRAEINGLRDGNVPEDIEEYETIEAAKQIATPAATHQPRFVKEAIVEVATEPKIRKPSALKTNWEKFIGENLINKIGIAIIVLGVGIGAKYAIDNDLISPLTRITLGYLAGLGLLVFAIKLKAKYEKFSAVLLGGSLAILYFITFAAYDFYDLIPQPLAFALMVILTAFTVLSAIKYNMQVIAHIGLVGAYAVPFLLSTGEGNVVILFSYMAIINAGILIIAFKRNWKKLYYSAFLLTWLIFSVWTASEYYTDPYFITGLVFNITFFLLFYAILLAYKVVKREKFKIDDIILLLANSFIFYSFGYYFLNGHETGSQLLGVFTVINALIHFVIGFILYKKELADKNLFYFVAGLVLVFITIAVPVQLDGSWVTLLWAGEAVLLFWIGRTKGVPVYEKLSYFLMIIGFFSLVQDWDNNTISLYFDYKQVTINPFFNIAFATSLLVAASYGFINYLNLNKAYISPFKEDHILSKIVLYGVPAVFIIVLFNTFRIEISNYWSQRYIDSTIKIQDEYDQQDYDLLTFRDVWIMYYTMFFFAVLTFINIRRLKNKALAAASLILSALTILSFLGSGLYFLSELRDSYLNQTSAEYFNRGWFSIGIRYIGIALLGILLVAMYRQIQQGLITVKLKKTFEVFLAITIIWVLSSELLNIMDIFGQTNSYRLSLSILWGVCSLALITLGIASRLKHLRISAIALFGVTLLKLFFFDIADLNTISKTIVFVSLGILLLIISFLYNKYKHLIFEEDEKE